MLEQPVKTCSQQQLPGILGDAGMLLDCRKLEDYKAKHLEGALWVHDDLINSIILNQDKDQVIVAYCYQGHRSGHLVEALNNAGFKRAYSLQGEIVYP